MDILYYCWLEGKHGQSFIITYDINCVVFVDVYYHIQEASSILSFGACVCVWTMNERLVLSSDFSVSMEMIDAFHQLKFTVWPSLVDFFISTPELPIGSLG